MLIFYKKFFSSHLIVTLHCYNVKIERGKVMEILKVENLRKTYGKGENIVNAVDDISFSVEKGEFIAIIGASGSRKINTSSFNRGS